MRVAYVCIDPGIPVFGTKGASVHVQEIIREFLAAGHDVTVYATRVGEDIPEDLKDLPVKRFAIKEKEPAAREQAQRDTSYAIAAQVLADDQEFVYERYSLFSTVIANTGLPAILEVNAPLIDEQATHRVLVDREYPVHALKLQVQSAKATICVSEQVAHWVEHTTGVSHTVHAVANGVNVNRITPQPEAEGLPVVTFVGTLKPWHGTHDLLSAKSLAKTDWRLRIIGDGPERENLLNQAKDLGIDVDFRGAVAPADVPQHLAGSAIGVAPYPKSDDHYFSPLKVYEYMAAGLPVVATSIGQVPATIDGCGLLVPGSDPQSLADAIDRLVADPALRKSLAGAARERAVTHHSWESVLTRALELAYG